MGYNAQIAVDAKHKLIVEQQVTNQVVDMGLLTQTAAPAKAVLDVETIAVVADRGYFKIEDIEACEQAGMNPMCRDRSAVPRWGPVPQGRVRRRPDQRQHQLSGRPTAGSLFIVFDACAEEGQLRQQGSVCRLRDPIAMHERRVSSVSRLENEAVLDRMQTRLRAADFSGYSRHYKADDQGSAQSNTFIFPSLPRCGDRGFASAVRRR